MVIAMQKNNKDRKIQLQLIMMVQLQHFLVWMQRIISVIATSKNTAENFKQCSEKDRNHTKWASEHSEHESRELDFPWFNT